MSATRWLAAIAAVLLVGVAAGQEAATVNPGGQSPPESKPQQQQEAMGPGKSEPEASTAKTEEAVTPAKTPPAQPTIQSRKDKVSYAFGVGLARDMQRQGNDLNVDLLVRALTDALAGKNLLMTDEEVTATVKTFEAERKLDYKHAEMMIAQKNKKAVEAFVADNAKKEGVVSLPSGLQYKVLKQGDGKMPTLDDHVVCNYRGTLVDGTEIDSSYGRKQPPTLPVKGVMAGWAEALQLMPVGSKWQIFIPPQLAYGEKIVGGIGPNAMVIFELELLSITDKPEMVSKR
jgi:FKBP-type peptidyl-prolyl cis-trans isomerase FklB